MYFIKSTCRRVIVSTSLLTLLVLLTFSFASYADPLTNPPQYINLQAVLVDNGGNVLTDRQESDINFKILDRSGTVHYEENQHVILVYGAISVLIGQGNDVTTGLPTGGIPAEAFAPDGDRILRFQLEDQTVPQEDLQLVSVPYAYYSQYALHVANPIGTEDILDSTIGLIDLGQEVLDYINNAMGEEAGVTADGVSVRNNFVNLSGDNVQDIFQSVDTAINIRSADGADDLAAETAERTAAEAALQAAISAEESARETGDTSLQTALTQETTDRQTGDTTLQTALTQETTDRQTGDANLQTALTQETTDRQTADTALQTALTQETTDRTTADTNLQEALNQEMADRIAGDETLATAVNNAQTTADGAQSSANTAQSTADTAQTSANNAQTSANAAQTTANQAVSDAANAQSTANSAQSTANTAVSNAATAQSTANSATSAANAAQSTANTAETNAQTGIANAAAAQSTADALGVTVDSHTAELANHEGRIYDLERIEVTDPSYNSVTVTGSPTGNPTANTIYKNNQILAWARVQSNWNSSTDNSVTLLGGFNFSTTIERDPAFASGTHDCVNNDTSCYKLTFLTRPSSISSYAVQAIVVDITSSGYAVIREIQPDSFIIQTISDSSSTEPKGADFDIVVVGY